MAAASSQTGTAGARMGDSPRWRTPLIVGVTLVASVAVVLFVLYARGGGPVPQVFSFLSPGPGELLAPSGPEETVLRSLRLAGVERATVGEERGVALVRFEIPAVSSAGDVEIAWQTGMATLVSAYPRADEYVVQLFANETPLIEAVAVDAGSARAAVEADDPAALEELVEFTLLLGEEVPDE